MNKNLDKYVIDEEFIRRKTLVIICNVAPPTAEIFQSDYSSPYSEYLSDNEFEEIIDIFSRVGIQMQFFLSEDDFFRYYFSNEDKDIKDIIVYNSAQSGSGPGRKSLIPAFCNLYNIPYTGSNAYAVSICRHKYHLNKLLSSLNVPVPSSWLYNDGWLFDVCPTTEHSIIIKPVYESSSIGINNKSLQIYHRNTDLVIDELQRKMKQPIIVQEFIPGYEVEVPVIAFSSGKVVLSPIGINIEGEKCLKHTFLDYKHVFLDNYSFYSYQEENGEVCQHLKKSALKVTEALGLHGLCRVDFRVSEDNQYKVFDVSTNPHFVEHSSVRYAMKIDNISTESFAKAIISTAVK